jgi:hypothetical protein
MTGKRRVPDGLKARDELALLLGLKDPAKLDRMSLSKIKQLAERRKVDPDSKPMKFLGNSSILGRNKTDKNILMTNQTTSTSTSTSTKRLLPTVRQVRANAIRRFKRALKKHGVDPAVIPKEAVEGFYDELRRQSPRVALKTPMGLVEGFSVHYERDGQEYVLGESRMGELFAESRQRKGGKAKWKSIITMPAKIGVYTWAQNIADPGLLSLGFKGGGHRAFRVMSDIDLDNIVRICQRAKRIRLRAKLKR